jgi:uncharacterized peroxidase-related enzyme
VIRDAYRDPAAPKAAFFVAQTDEVACNPSSSASSNSHGDAIRAAATEYARVPTQYRRKSKETIMARIQPVNLEETTGKTKELIDAVKAKLGRVPNLMATMAHSPAVLESYLAFSGAVGHTSLSPRLREQLAVAVGEQNGCDYCVAAHSALGKRAGLSDDELIKNRRGTATDAKANAAIRFARRIVDERGHVGDDGVNEVRNAGFTDGEILEIVAATALNIYTNYFNHIVDTQIDFPAAPALDAA